MNEALLGDNAFQNAVEGLIHDLEEDKTGWCQSWDMFKMRIWELAIERSSIIRYYEKKKGSA